METEKIHLQNVHDNRFNEVIQNGEFKRLNSELIPLTVSIASLCVALSAATGRGVAEITRIRPAESVRRKPLFLVNPGTDNERLICVRTSWFCQTQQIYIQGSKA